MSMSLLDFVRLAKAEGAGVRKLALAKLSHKILVMPFRGKELC